MNILEGVKPFQSQSRSQSVANPTKFIIKSKSSAKEHNTQNDSLVATNQDVNQFIPYMLTKSKRFSELLDAKRIADDSQFAQKHLYHNSCFKTILKSIFDKMLAERRIGKNLKGINKGILNEIENGIWQCIERQAALYQVQSLYQQQKENLLKEISNRQSQIQAQIQELANVNQIERELVEEVEEHHF